MRWLVSVSLLVLSAFFLASCLSRASVERVEPAESVMAPDTFDHSVFTDVLLGVVDERGYVDYATLVADSTRLDEYLAQLAATDPSNLADADRLAFWLNTYNAYTLKLIVDNYPVESIRDVVDGTFVPLVNTPFKVDFVTVAGEVMTLDDVEHGRYVTGTGDGLISRDDIEAYAVQRTVMEIIQTKGQSVRSSCQARTAISGPIPAGSPQLSAMGAGVRPPARRRGRRG